MNMEDAALDLQLSRIISAVEQTTIFTTIVPKPTAQSEGTTTADSPVVTVTQESNSDNGSSGLPGTKIFGALEIIIALGVLGMDPQSIYSIMTNCYSWCIASYHEHHSM